MPSEQKPVTQQSTSYEQQSTVLSEIAEHNSGEYLSQVHNLKSLGGEALQSAGVEISRDSVLYKKFETDGFITSPPHLFDILDDTSRTNQITSVRSLDRMGPYTEKSSNETITVSEHTAVNEIDAFLRIAAELSPGSLEGDIAARMRESMTFIGQHEYAEASKGIATYWKEYLTHNQQAQLVILTSAGRNGAAIKSDHYMLDNVLAHFSDEDTETFKERISINPAAIDSDPDETKIVMVEDWIIDGIQLGEQYNGFLQQYAGYEDSMEVQLLVASAEQIDEGIINQGLGYLKTYDAPIKAYYQTDFDNKDQPITGFHSSSDHHFNDQIMYIAKNLNLPQPAGTNIVRPYRQPDARFDNVARFARSDA